MGTLGGATRMFQATRLMPRRLPAGIVSTSFPSGPRISILIFPNRWRVLLVVSDHSAGDRVPTDKCSVPLGPSPLSRDALGDGLGLQKGEILFEHVIGQSAQGSDVVHDPYPPAVGAHHQGVVPPLDGDILG